MATIGIDLAWGEKNPDGVTAILFEHGVGNPPSQLSTTLTHGDEALLATLQPFLVAERIIVAIDAPTICRNEEGSRPVDQECTRLFRQYEAGCHPVNRQLCSRPFRIAERFKTLGFSLTTNLASSRLVAEVYPHPATIRLFGIEKTIKYKKGVVALRRKEFSRYQQFLVEYLSKEMPWVMKSASHQQLLASAWKKDIEDQVDSILCASIAFRHVKYGGERSQVLGDDHHGHMLIPKS